MIEKMVNVLLQETDRTLLRGLVPYLLDEYRECHHNEAIAGMLERLRDALDASRQQGASCLDQSERLWWAVLVDAEMFSQMRDLQNEGDWDLNELKRSDTLICLTVANVARCMLRDQFGVDLDVVSERARQKYLELYEELKAQQRAEKERWERFKRLIDASKGGDKNAMRAALDEIERHGDNANR